MNNKMKYSIMKYYEMNRWRYRIMFSNVNFLLANSLSITCIVH